MTSVSSVCSVIGALSIAGALGVASVSAGEDAGVAGCAGVLDEGKTRLLGFGEHESLASGPNGERGTSMKEDMRLAAVVRGCVATAVGDGAREDEQDELTEMMVLFELIDNAGEYMVARLPKPGPGGI